MISWYKSPHLFSASSNRRPTVLTLHEIVDMENRPTNTFAQLHIDGNQFPIIGKGMCRGRDKSYDKTPRARASI